MSRTMDVYFEWRGERVDLRHIIIKKLRLIIIKLRLTVIKLVKLDNNNFITGVIDTRTPHFTVIEYGRRPRGRVRHVPGHGWGI